VETSRGLLKRIWDGPADLPRALETEWRLVTVRWIAILFVAPAVGVLPLSPDRLPVAWLVLCAGALFNVATQVTLPRRPTLFLNGYLTTLFDGLLSVAFISLVGGFDSAFYFLLYPVTIAAALRYGYGPTAVMIVSFVSCDLGEGWLLGQAPDGALLLRSGFLALSGLLAGHLCAQMRVAEKALRTQLQHAEHTSLHDTLTGLPNRTLLVQRVEQAIAMHHPNEAMALLIVDLDRFKDVNDTLGHHFGDVLLAQVTGRFAECLTSGATLARLGGDEFAVLLPRSDATFAIVTAQGLLAALLPPFAIEEHQLDVGASIGIALYPADGQHATALLRHGDVAMYVAKRSGSGYAVYAADQDQHSPERLALVGELRHAIDNDELVLHFQPKISLSSGRVIGAEALVRWQHSQRGLMAPDQFIGLAEQTGLIRPLSRWVLNETLRQSAAWRRAGIDVSMAVNLSMRDLHDPDLPQIVGDLLARWGTVPSDLVLEITENGLMAEPARALDTATRLRALGVRLAIDDFGTGYSSLAYLKRLPVSELKIDRSFVRDMAVDDDDATIVRSTIGLAHDLGLNVVAEGIEDRASYDLLKRLGCDVAQGYFMSRPIPARDFEAWYRVHAREAELHLAA